VKKLEKLPPGKLLLTEMFVIGSISQTLPLLIFEEILVKASDSALEDLLEKLDLLSSFVSSRKITETTIKEVRII
jgi:hypothetical protein